MSLSEDSRIWTPPEPSRTTEPGQPLRLLSFNIQVGMETRHYGDYVMRAWRHALPGPAPGLRATLDRIAMLARDYDFVAIQEADAGSLRTGFLNQMMYLAERAAFAYYGFAVTRDLRPVARHCLGFLSRFPTGTVEDHALPGPIKGRRVLRVPLRSPQGQIDMLVAHLSLGPATQRRQLEFLSRLVAPGTATVLMGDLNCEPEALRRHPALREAGFWVPDNSPLTFPSWRPRTAIDHILLSPQLQVHRLESLPHAISDHLPLAAEVSLLTPA